MEIIKKFESESYEITTIKVKEEIYFKGKEIAEILGYNDTDKAIRNHVEDEDKSKLEELVKIMGERNVTPKNLTKILTLQNGGSKNLTNNEKKSIYINESGLYSLILRSKLKEAKEFKSWVTSEVLPSLRKTGKYEISTNEQRLKEITMGLNILQMIDMVDDSIKNIAYSETKNIINNKNLNTDNNDELDYPITRRIKDLGYSYSSKKDRSNLIKVGKLITKLYYEKYDEKPKKRNAYVDGQMREINFYTSKDFDIMDEAIERYFGENEE
jgi:prophage antirepressor-like protein